MPTNDWLDLARAVGVVHEPTPIYDQLAAERRVEAGIEATAADLVDEIEAYLQGQP